MNAIPFFATREEDLLMDKIGFEVHRLKLIVGRKPSDERMEAITKQIEAVDEAIQKLEDFVDGK